MVNPKKVLVKDLTPKWLQKATRKGGDSIAWSLLGVLVSGLDSRSKLDTPRLFDIIRRRDVGELFAYTDTWTPTQYASPALLLQDRLVVDCLKKFNFSTSPFNKKERALIRFWDAEHLCWLTNCRIRSSVYHSGTNVPENDILYCINYARNTINSILGNFRSDELLDHSRFGPGATLCVKGAFTTEYYKWACTSPTCGSKTLPYAEALLNHDHKWRAFLSGLHPLDVVGRFNLISDKFAPELSITDQNKVTFVPKNAKTLRSIAIEPYFNLYFQLGVGGMIRKRLRKWGIDLNTQENNQMAAKLGSVTGKLATIDFSMASDTIAIETVRLLIPDEWFTHLERLRSPEFLLNGNKYRYQKFSSMGNGFTFELETMIFASIARAACEYNGTSPKDVTVFGDDVIIPVNAVDTFERACSFLGFRINAEKSFVSGPFRESCGADFLKGAPVRPVYADDFTTVRDVASYSNRLLALNNSVVFDDWDSSWLLRAIDTLRSFIPKDVRKHLVGPASDSVDTYIHVDNPEALFASQLLKWNKKTQSWQHPYISFRPLSRKRKGPAAALYIIQGTRIEPPDSLFEIREGRRSEITARKLGEVRFGYRPCDGLHGLTLVRPFSV